MWGLPVNMKRLYGFCRIGNGFQFSLIFQVNHTGLMESPGDVDFTSGLRVGLN